MRVAIFGGSFDPPHIAHENIIKKALKELNIKMLFVVPTFLNPFKNNSFAPATQRYKWVKKLLQRYKKAQIINFELKQKRPTPTIESIKYIKNRYHVKKIYLIIGADNLKNLHKWQDYQKLKKMVEFVIITRDNIKVPKHLKKIVINDNISSTNLRDNLKYRYLPKTIANEVMNFYGSKN